MTRPLCHYVMSCLVVDECYRIFLRKLKEVETITLTAITISSTPSLNHEKHNKKGKSLTQQL